MKYGKNLSKTKLGFINKFFSNLIFCIIISVLFNEYNFESYIKLTINKTGGCTLFNKIENFYPPSEIYINNIKQENVINFYNFDELNNKVKLIWEKTSFTNISYLFFMCPFITEIDLSHFNSSNIIDMNHMFYGCSSLKSINFSGFDTSKVSRTNNMFENCSGLTSLDLKTFNTKNIFDMSNMFDHCSSLKSLDLSSFDTSNVKFMDKMFSKCESLEILNIRNFNLSQVNSSNNMFSECSKLIFINFGRGFLGMDNINIFSSIYNIFM